MFNIAEPNVPQIPVEGVKASIDAHEDVILLDVRTTGEYSRGKIAGGVNLPLDEVSNKVESVILDKSATIYVYCLSGSRSIYAVESMLQLGYVNVFNVTNGLLAWRSKGYPVSA
jgi:rhodanese-related sulfurtransferase